MDESTIFELATLQKNAEATVDYIAYHLRFLRKREKALICFPEYSEDTIGGLMVRAVRKCGAEPVIWREDLRWKSLLRLAFSTRASTLIGAPLIILGLSKIARYNRVPLFVRNVVCAGYPSFDWMVDGIIKGLDCRAWGCFDVHMRNVVAGFSCSRSRGVHLREDVYGVEIVDALGNPLPDGERGNIVLFDRENPKLRHDMGDQGRIERVPCACGSKYCRIMDIGPGLSFDKDLLELGQYLQSWSSVLDCRLRKGPGGLEVEIVSLPGEKLPKLPSCAKLVLRPWNPEEDEPYPYILDSEII